MKTFGRNENYRVVIEPRRLGALGSVSVPDSWMASDEAQRQRLYKERCEEIAADARRHVDNVGSICVEFDTINVCGHCGAEWTEKRSDYNGGCCDADQDAEDARTAEATQPKDQARG